MKYEIAIVIIVSVFAGMALLSLLTAFITYRMTFYTKKKKKADPFYDLKGELSPRKQKSRAYIEELLTVPCEKVEIKSFDGLKLSARYYHVNDGAPIEIQCHGYRSNSIHDFSGGALECIKMGYNLLLIDQRAHGESEGKTISFGINERRDVLSWVEYLNARFGMCTQIILYGVSMGAATVLMAGELSLAQNVVCIVADSPYSSPKDIICKVVSDMHLPPKLFYPFIKLGARIFGRFDLEECAPITAVENIKIPVLILHGEGDEFVPPEMSRRIASCAPTASFAAFAEAGHCLAFIYDYDGYMAVVNEFYGKVIKNNECK